MKLQNLREFVELAKSKNYSVVAEKMYVSQPSVSRHIREIEEELGVNLFDRSTRRVELTEYGLYFLPYAMKMITLEDEYTAGLASMENTLKRTLVIGVVRQAELAVSEMISEYSGLHPEVRFNIVPGESEDLRAQLKDNKYDCVFIREPSPAPQDNLGRITISATPLRVVLNTEHRLAKREEIDIQELRDEIFLLSENTSLATKLGKAAAAEAGFDLNIVFQGLKSQILNLVHHGTGISLLFPNPQDLVYDNLVTVPLTPHHYVNINFLYRHDTQHWEKHSDFVSFVRSHSAVDAPSH